MDAAVEQERSSDDPARMAEGAQPPASAPAEPPPEAVAGLVGEYVEEMRRNLGVPIAVPPPPAGVRRINRFLVLGAVGLGAAVAGALLAVARTPPPSQAPAALAATPEGAACLARQERVLDALAAWTAAHGSPPATLDALRPRYLEDPPVDPASGRPFLYSRDAGGLHLVCPDHPVATPAMAPAGGGSGPPA